MGFFAAGGETNEFSKFKIDSICLPTFLRRDSFSIGLHRPPPHAKLSGTNPEMGTSRVNLLVEQLNSL